MIHVQMCICVSWGESAKEQEFIKGIIKEKERVCG